MDLAKQTRAASVFYSGNQKFSVADDKQLKIETTPDGLDILMDGPTEGKKWNVKIVVQVTETDA